ncbi:hypothetical protein [Sigmofec virus UA08Rod_6044]|uniref:Uncharacterized protein n=1 Tax=Sigmofec virus UA08Rod_6044 TaxID=2929448 RepID=A0A976N0S0_9VIRU|nr:hypothetical protein [Sigmofec virus UA08Rod_6044]
MKRKRMRKKENIKMWKKGINNVKDINVEYPRNQRGGIRF